ncbi:hypothetical protein B0H11DRAFT_2227153 [Mycena galericulata]|nr:hypothetical protein B0H11DRAFT_2227153 [Mycena galericulata]
MSLKSQYIDLKASFASQSPDLSKCDRLLTQLKLGLIQEGLLLPQADLDPDDLVFTREILDIGTFWSIRQGDMPSFDRYFSQLQTFYMDYMFVPFHRHLVSRHRKVGRSGIWSTGNHYYR